MLELLYQVQINLLHSIAGLATQLRGTTSKVEAVMLQFDTVMLRLDKIERDLLQARALGDLHPMQDAKQTVACEQKSAIS